MTAFARSYAQAFLQTAPPGYDVERFLEGAGAVRDSLSGDARLRSFFLSPSVPLAEAVGRIPSRLRLTKATGCRPAKCRSSS